MQFREVSVIKSNITSSMDMRKSFDKFGVMTRQLASSSSKWVYRLEIYDFEKIQKLSSVDVYQSYSQENHFIKFVADKNLVVVNTKFEIKFYQLDPLSLKKNYLHNQMDVYDLQASPDGELVVMVGREISIWRTNGFRRIIFPHVIESSRKCAFSKDNKFMAISTNSQINIYTFQRVDGDYLFTPIEQTFQPPLQNQDITSIEFSPTDSNEMVVAFLNVSPQFLRIDTGYFVPMKDIQPLASKNEKKATYMPDGKRFLSSDAMNGIGIWPGIKNNLFYREGYLLYSLIPNSIGTKLLGRVWQQIKLVQIEVECKPQNFRTQCDCLPDYIWDYASYSCQPLSCLQKQNATGQKRNNECVCIDGFYFNKALRKCLINCGSLQNTVKISPNAGFCYCKDNYVWDAVQKKCVFNCKEIPYSTGQMISKEKCQCKQGFIWGVEFKECVCPSYSFVSGSSCVCYENYLEVEGKCIADCKKIQKSTGNSPSGQQCQCQSGYYFTQLSFGKTGCKPDCTKYPNTQLLSPGIDGCLCVENMNWVNKTCKINCNSVEYASGASTEKQNACNCAVNYLWIDEIHECGRNCTGIANINSTKKSTLKTCPCINNFNWNDQKLICEVDCSKINNTNPYSLSNPSECQCRGAYDWMKDQFKCRINCSKIWDTKDQVDDYSCNCNGDKQFNQNQLACDAASAAGFFSSIWTILGFVACIIVFCIIMIILVRYCWQFSTKHNKEHQKRLKTNDVGQKPRKKKVNKEKDIIENNNLLSDDRLKTKTTI